MASFSSVVDTQELAPALCSAELDADMRSLEVTAANPLVSSSGLLEASSV